MAKQLWSIKYRPKTLDDYIFKDDNHRALVERWVTEKNIPHIFLKGHRGTGKTSLALLLKNLLEVEDSDFLSLNASDDNNIETIRNKVKNFISTFAYGPFKIVLLDEADGLTPAAQGTLKSMMEEFSDNARFNHYLNCGFTEYVMDLPTYPDDGSASKRVFQKLYRVKAPRSLTMTKAEIEMYALKILLRAVKVG
jgi:DNA polymerase III gamma/tau subunit